MPQAIEDATGPTTGKTFAQVPRRILRRGEGPDTRFKDFHNHVIHVDENNWGGASLKVPRMDRDGTRTLQQIAMEASRLPVVFCLITLQIP